MDRLSSEEGGIACSETSAPASPAQTSYSPFERPNASCVHPVVYYAEAASTRSDEERVPHISSSASPFISLRADSSDRLRTDESCCASVAACDRVNSSNSTTARSLTSSGSSCRSTPIAATSRVSSTGQGNVLLQTDTFLVTSPRTSEDDDDGCRLRRPRWFLSKPSPHLLALLQREAARCFLAPEGDSSSRRSNQAPDAWASASPTFHGEAAGADEPRKAVGASNNEKAVLQGLLLQARRALNRGSSVCPYTFEERGETTRRCCGQRAAAGPRWAAGVWETAQYRKELHEQQQHQPEQIPRQHRQQQEGREWKGQQEKQRAAFFSSVIAAADQNLAANGSSTNLTARYAVARGRSSTAPGRGRLQITKKSRNRRGEEGEREESLLSSDAEALQAGPQRGTTAPQWSCVATDVEGYQAPSRKPFYDGDDFSADSGEDEEEEFVKQSRETGDAGLRRDSSFFKQVEPQQAAGTHTHARLKLYFQQSRKLGDGQGSQQEEEKEETRLQGGHFLLDEVGEERPVHGVRTLQQQAETAQEPFLYHVGHPPQQKAVTHWEEHSCSVRTPQQLEKKLAGEKSEGWSRQGRETPRAKESQQFNHFSDLRHPADHALISSSSSQRRLVPLSLAGTGAGEDSGVQANVSGGAVAADLAATSDTTDCAAAVAVSGRKGEEKHQYQEPKHSEHEDEDQQPEQQQEDYRKQQDDQQQQEEDKDKQRRQVFYGLYAFEDGREQAAGADDSVASMSAHLAPFLPSASTPGLPGVGETSISLAELAQPLPPALPPEEDCSWALVLEAAGGATTAAAAEAAAAVMAAAAGGMESDAGREREDRSSEHLHATEVSQADEETNMDKHQLAIEEETSAPAARTEKEFCIRETPRHKWHSELTPQQRQPKTAQQQVAPQQQQEAVPQQQQEAPQQQQEAPQQQQEASQQQQEAPQQQQEAVPQQQQETSQQQQQEGLQQQGKEAEGDAGDGQETAEQYRRLKEETRNLDDDKMKRGRRRDEERGGGGAVKRKDGYSWVRCIEDKQQQQKRKEEAADTIAAAAERVGKEAAATELEEGKTRNIGGFTLNSAAWQQRRREKFRAACGHTERNWVSMEETGRRLEKEEEGHAGAEAAATEKQPFVADILTGLWPGLPLPAVFSSAKRRLKVNRSHRGSCRRHSVAAHPSAADREEIAARAKDVALQLLQPGEDADYFSSSSSSSLVVDSAGEEASQKKTTPGGDRRSLLPSLSLLLPSAPCGATAAAASPSKEAEMHARAAAVFPALPSATKTGHPPAAGVAMTSVAAAAETLAVSPSSSSSSANSTKDSRRHAALPPCLPSSAAAAAAAAAVAAVSRLDHVASTRTAAAYRDPASVADSQRQPLHKDSCGPIQISRFSSRVSSSSPSSSSSSRNHSSSSSNSLSSSSSSSSSSLSTEAVAIGFLGVAEEADEGSAACVSAAEGGAAAPPLFKVKEVQDTQKGFYFSSNAAPSLAAALSFPRVDTRDRAAADENTGAAAPTAPPTLFQRPSSSAFPRLLHPPSAAAAAPCSSSGAAVHLLATATASPGCEVAASAAGPAQQEQTVISVAGEQQKDKREFTWTKEQQQQQQRGQRSLLQQAQHDALCCDNHGKDRTAAFSPHAEAAAPTLGRSSRASSVEGAADTAAAAPRSATAFKQLPCAAAIEEANERGVFPVRENARAVAATVAPSLIESCRRSADAAATSRGQSSGDSSNLSSSGGDETADHRDCERKGGSNNRKANGWNSNSRSRSSSSSADANPQSGVNRIPFARRTYLLIKKLNFLLRHGAPLFHLPMREDGYVRIRQLLELECMRGVTWEELYLVVASNFKRRYEICYDVNEPERAEEMFDEETETETCDASSRLSGGEQQRLSSFAASVAAGETTSPLLKAKAVYAPRTDAVSLVSEQQQKQQQGRKMSDRWLMRATQGHTIRRVSSDLLLQRVRTTAALPTCVHGTYMRNWISIRQHGLHRMHRNHIHFAVGLPSECGVLSGMRRNSEVAIYIDVEKAMADGISFFRSNNNVILTEGKNGNLPAKYFLKAIHLNWGVVLFENGRDYMALYYHRLPADLLHLLALPQQQQLQLQLQQQQQEQQQQEVQQQQQQQQQQQEQQEQQPQQQQQRRAETQEQPQQLPEEQHETKQIY